MADGKQIIITIERWGEGSDTPEGEEEEEESFVKMMMKHKMPSNVYYLL